MQIKLKSITLINFKGIRNRSFDFLDHNFLFGDNGKGKTTVFDAFTWLLFGKDSDGRADFGIKTFDQDNNVIERIDHEVMGVLEIDGKATEFKRVLRDKWVTKRGSETEVFEGNETTYFIDDVPLKKSEFEQRINDLINESVFKLITSPTAFNSLHWSKQREMLISIAGGIDEGQIIMGLDATSDQKQWLINILASESSIDQQKKAIASRIKTQRDEMKLIAPRIDEVERSKPDAVDFKSLTEESQKIKQTIEDLDSKINNSEKMVQDSIDKVTVKKREAYEVQKEIDRINANLRRQAVEKCSSNEAEEIDAQIKRLNAKSELIDKDIKAIEFRRGNLEAHIEKYRKQWDEVSKSEFIVNENECICPTCKQELTDKDSKIEQLRANFNRDKAKKLEEINAEGVRTKNQTDEMSQEVIKLVEDQKELIKAVNLLIIKKKAAEPLQTVDEVFSSLRAFSKDFISNHKKRDQLEDEVEALEAQIQHPDTFPLKEEISALNKRIFEIRTELGKEQQIEEANKRIEELKAQEKAIAKAIAEAERSVFLIERFTKASIETIETKINAMFEVVKFKMFESQINGGESETCLCLTNGVPYSDLNHASKINAGMDIINTLSNHYGVNAPIFVDGRESVINLIETNSQVINLVVMEGEDLRIVGN